MLPRVLFFRRPNVNIAGTAASFAILTNDVSIPGEGKLEVTESSLDPRPLGPSGAALDPLSVPSMASLAVTERAKNHGTAFKSLCTRKRLTSGSGTFKLTVLLASLSSGESASFS